MEKLIYFLFRRRTFFLLLGTFTVILLSRPTYRSVVIGLPLVVAGTLVRLWSAGCLRKIESLITSGPFALCRNPLYIGSFLIMGGYLVMANWLDVGIVGVVLFWMFHAGAVAHEEKILRGIFGQEFDDYCARVPRFFPRLRLSEARGGFSFRQMKWNREHQAVVTTAVAVCIFLLIAHFGSPLEFLGRG